MPPEPDLESCTASFQVSGTTHDFNFVAGPPEYSFDVCSTPLFLEGAVTCAASCVDTSGNRSQEVDCPANTFPNLAPSLPEILLDPNG